MTAIFDEQARATFASSYPETPHKIAHRLDRHPLLTLAGLARLGEALPPASVEYNRGDLPVGIAPEDVPANGLGIGDTIRGIAETNSWAVLKNVEQDAAYRDLLADLLAELKPAIEAKTGRLLTPQAFIFVSSPGSMTPYHFDPEHNILMQLRGTKRMVQFPAGDPRFAPQHLHEAYHTGGHRNLGWQDWYDDAGTPFDLAPGEALFVPVMAPHYVRNGPEPSISLSITWRSDWSYREADAHAFNRLLRQRFGMNPRAPGRFPASNIAKAYGWRAAKRLGVRF